ncbi:hypothetical protein Ddye_013125 [Dipteronia dyeriana]|uniref:Transposase-associated domain-containing protein n=1 Tax=Dipteronia dyeriana TaxID=168575 RepID=A0AAD9X5Q4_9ROSI|nr:hypothetical protein Ddye_013125 [Dipteronia dyeriana]
MDKSWMSNDRLSKEYVDGVDQFLAFASAHTTNFELMRCPCQSCANLKFKTPREIRYHLFSKGIDQRYGRWIWHGEVTCTRCSTNGKATFVEQSTYKDAANMVKKVQDAFEFSKENPKLFENLLEDAEKPLYPGCLKYTKLSTLMRLYNIKGKYGWSDSSFSNSLNSLKDMFPIGNEIPSSMYEAKKTMTALGLEFKRLFQSSKIARDLTWHATGREKDGKLCHLVDSPSWKLVDRTWPHFSAKTRNLRLVISADGINPHSSLSSLYSCWPMVMVTYNLPSWLCMKRKFMMLSLLISGPYQPGNDFDVYLAPLIKDLKTLWEVGVEVYDAYKQERFNLWVVLLWTINDFPAYRNFSGSPTKGYFACPICGGKTNSCRLHHEMIVRVLGLMMLHWLKLNSQETLAALTQSPSQDMSTQSVDTNLEGHSSNKIQHVESTKIMVQSINHTVGDRRALSLGKSCKLIVRPLGDVVAMGITVENHNAYTTISIDVVVDNDASLPILNEVEGLVFLGMH